MKRKSSKQLNLQFDPNTSIIAIIGAGISGLATALQIVTDQQQQQQENQVKLDNIQGKEQQQLYRLCHTIHIYERDIDFDHKQYTDFSSSGSTSHNRYCNNGDDTTEGNDIRTKEKKNDGYGLTISYQPYGILYNLGILDEVTNNDCPSRSHYILNSNGNILGYFGNAFVVHEESQSSNGENGSSNNNGNGNGNGYGQRGNIRIPRQQLRNILLQKLLSFNNNNQEKIVYPNIQIHYNHKLRSINTISSSSSSLSSSQQQQQELSDDTDPNNKDSSQCHSCIHTAAATTTSNQERTKVQLIFVNGNTSTVDLVIAADGIRSTVVREWLSSKQPSIESTPPPTIPKPSPSLLFPSSLNVRIILGITDDFNHYNLQQHNNHSHNNSSHHELLHERGFYTLQNGHRLFVMPYTGSTLHRSINENEPIRFMWQLSFYATTNDNENNNNYNNTNKNYRNSKYTGAQLKQEALERTNNWHEPVTTLIQMTSIDNIWGTMLHDHNPNEIGQQLINRNKLNPHVIIIGDAIHAMSPFKGQGANQCLKDAVTVSKWLYKSRNNIKSAIQCITREIVQRTTPIVTASRIAAQYWHTNIDSTIESDIDHPFTGLNDNEQLKRHVLLELQQRNINAGTTINLDKCVLEVINDCRRKYSNQYCKDSTIAKSVSDCSTGSRRSNSSSSNETDTSEIHPTTNDTCIPINVSKNITFPSIDIESIGTMAYIGNTGMLRKISWYYPNYIRSIKLDDHQLNEITGIYKSSNHTKTFHHNSNNRNGTDNGSHPLLHIAIMGGNIRTVHWLITEAGCNMNECSTNSPSTQTVFDIASKYNHKDIHNLLQRLRTTTQT